MYYTAIYSRTPQNLQYGYTVLYGHVQLFLSTYAV